MEQLVGAVLALVGSVVAGTITHELSHAVSLSVLGIPYDVETFRAGASGDAGRLSAALVSVVPNSATESTSGLRVAALMPLTLALPLVLVPLGVVPDPFATGDLAAQFAVIGWLACAVPSPQDFSVVWYAHRDQAGGS